MARIRQVLPVLGSDLLTPKVGAAESVQAEGMLYCRIKDAEAKGQRTPNGFVVFSGSTAVLKARDSSEAHPYVLTRRRELLAEGLLVEKNGFLTFTKDTEFSSPSAAAAVVHGGSANGLTAWKNRAGRSLKELEGPG